MFAGLILMTLLGKAFPPSGSFLESLALTVAQGLALNLALLFYGLLLYPLVSWIGLETLARWKTDPVTWIVLAGLSGAVIWLST